MAWDEAVTRYLAEILAHKPEEAVLTPVVGGSASSPEPADRDAPAAE